MDMLENFPKRLGLSRKQGCLFCGGKMQAVRKSAHFWLVEGSKRPREGGEEGGVSFSLLPALPTSPPIIMHVISQGAGRVSRTRGVSPSMESEKESDCVWTLFFFLTSQLISVRRRISGLTENYSFHSYSRGQIIQRFQILLCGFIPRFHPLLKWSFSQLTCLDRGD